MIWTPEFDELYRSLTPEQQLVLDQQKQVVESTVDELEMLSTIDNMTKAYNRRAFEEHLKQEMAKCKRNNVSTSLLMLDVDNFKKLNDTYGHLAGDHVLTEIVSRVRGTSRDQDLVGRLGGEEFGIILPETSSAGAFIHANKICREIRSKSFTYSDNIIPVTISVGISSIPSSIYGGVSLDQYLDSADKALYQAKNNGRDRVEIGSLELPQNYSRLA